MEETAKNNKYNLSELEFNGTWRSYQKRVLEELDIHLNDKKLNVVAAPGAGKTTLGIEVVKRLNKPALILTPTITIKNQWAQRIKTSFITTENADSIISTDLSDIKKITITTYQALHSLSKKKEEYEILFDKLKKQHVKTIVLDEAHHLRTEWYKTLFQLTKKLDSKDFTSVALTATPPYDVSLSEWQNYHNLCGSVDAEISIPELVKNKNLCPHQDLIYFCDLDEEESSLIKKYENNRTIFFEHLKTNADFSVAVKTSDFICNLENDIEIIYENTQFTLAIASFLLNEDDMSKEAYLLAEYLGLDISLVPQFNYIQAEILFNGILDDFTKHFPDITTTKKILKELHLLETHKKVDFTGRTQLKNVFIRSKNKLKAIKEITKEEYNTLKNDLREVILLDYIGKGESLGLNINSVFKELKNLNLELGILTGTLIIIPKTAKEELYKITKEANTNSENILTAEIDNDYLRVETYGDIDIVAIITELFRRGDIKVLIGTQALLGEGWDAPCTNTLIIASTIGSYMSSNQMRGRALRINKDVPNKNSNIWHIAAVYKNENNPDIETIIRRFNTFEGISYIDNNIQNGVERLGIDVSDIKNINETNKMMLARAKNRDVQATKWDQIFEKSNITEEYYTQQIYDIIETKTESIPKVVMTQNVSKIKNFFNTQIKKKYIKIIHDEHLALAIALYKTLNEHSILNNKNAIIKINVDENTLATSLTLTNCTNYERNVFIKAFNEIFTTNEKARYIIKKDSNYSLYATEEENYFKIFNFVFSFKEKEYTQPECIFKKDKYYFIPEILGTKKAHVETFLYHLRLAFGFFDAVYTRNPQGRSELLKALYTKEKCINTKISRKWI